MQTLVKVGELSAVQSVKDKRCRRSLGGRAPAPRLRQAKDFECLKEPDELLPVGPVHTREG